MYTQCALNAHLLRTRRERKTEGETVTGICCCGKRLYQSEDAAVNASYKLLRTKGRKVKAYSCPFGHGYHLATRR